MGLCGSSPEGDLLPVQRKDLLEHKALFDFLGFNGKERVGYVSLSGILTEMAIWRSLSVNSAKALGLVQIVT